MAEVTEEATEHEEQARRETLVRLEGVEKHFPIQPGFLSSLLNRGSTPAVRAVNGVDFEIRRGEVFGLAGESGSGKSTVGRLVVNLLEPTAGRVLFDGIDLSEVSAAQMRSLRSRMQVIFQDPLASLNPRMTIGQAISHPSEIHSPDLTSAARRRAVLEMLEAVGMTPPENFVDKYPHQISGGQRQRVVIARALITRPELIVADEPIAMADVSVRALLLDLMMDLKEQFDLTYLFITHDLATAKYVCDRLAVMYLGKIVEIGQLEDVFRAPVHPYTEALLAAVPVPDPTRRRTHPMPEGEIPNAVTPPSGCSFHPRCPLCEPDLCNRVVPELAAAPDTVRDDHLVACHVRAPTDR